jgi:hypothetical protein
LLKLPAGFAAELGARVPQVMRRNVPERGGAGVFSTRPALIMMDNTSLVTLH